MSLFETRKKVYTFFDEHIKDLILKNEKPQDEIIEDIYKVIDGKFDKTYDWFVNAYGNTIRVSVWVTGYNYTFFMVATPPNKVEYDFGVNYYGSRDYYNDTEGGKY